MSSTHWVLRCAITGDAFASQDARPEGAEFPVEWDGRECYWAEERAPRAPRPVETCQVCGSDAWNGVCEYDPAHSRRVSTTYKVVDYSGHVYMSGVDAATADQAVAEYHQHWPDLEWSFEEEKHA